MFCLDKKGPHVIFIADTKYAKTIREILLKYNNAKQHTDN